ncbi:D-alanyl-D-alanine carboxypeptidase family protein [Risungbinella massiliensis]|uniref:D-alanyl-D-alanine carboxypeptidase family protein n=1 Tax=Risungbinella massiliensis TaxID=1329796 RepID=UPI0038998373
MPMSSLLAAAPRETELAPSSRSAILMDADSGAILFEKNSHEKMPPASVTKVMTMLLIMEAIDTGKIKWTDKVRVSDRASSMGGSQIFLEPGEEMTVEEMLKGIALGSANDASVAMAEHLGGTEEGFVEMMNAKAKELGMNNTHFLNSNGLPVADHYTSAHDIAVMSRELLKHEEITKFTGIYQDHLRKDSEKPFWLVNTNKLVRFYQGLDGLKTGFTNEAKFCLSATAKRNNLRVIAVVMGEPDTKTRNAEVSGMLDYAFNQYTSVPFYKKGELIAKLDIEKGEPEQVEIRASRPISLLLKKGENARNIEKTIVWRELKTPLKKGEPLGKLQFKKQGNIILELDLISNTDIQQASLWDSFQKVMRNVLQLN